MTPEGRQKNITQSIIYKIFKKIFKLYVPNLIFTAKYVSECYLHVVDTMVLLWTGIKTNTIKLIVNWRNYDMMI